MVELFAEAVYARAPFYLAYSHLAFPSVWNENVVQFCRPSFLMFVEVSCIASANFP